MTESTKDNEPKCPECKFWIMTPWSETKYVCDLCGWGK